MRVPHAVAAQQAAVEGLRKLPRRLVAHLTLLLHRDDVLDAGFHKGLRDAPGVARADEHHLRLLRRLTQPLHDGLRRHHLGDAVALLEDEPLPLAVARKVQDGAVQRGVEAVRRREVRAQPHRHLFLAQHFQQLVALLLVAELRERNALAPALRHAAERHGHQVGHAGAGAVSHAAGCGLRPAGRRGRMRLMLRAGTSASAQGSN
mmetsp:Transcript_29344/g.94111  ORF Transcript_29344/g.94111 Transcript_29344/m.94111 type:complete len:205 (+) Transcript_29344:2883-3497(+)